MLELISLHPWREEGWETLRTIRNECAEFMTGRTTPISYEEQQEYRWAFDVWNQSAILLAVGGRAVGFLYLRRVEDHFVPTYGVRPEERGKGYGKVLVRLSQALADVIVLEVRGDNLRAVGLYFAEGFTEVGWKDDTMVMSWRRK